MSVMTIEQSLALWRVRKVHPNVIVDAWTGTNQHSALFNLWGWVYSYAYPWMTSLQVTGRLWQTFAKIAQEQLRGANMILDAGSGTGLISAAILDRSPNTQVIGADWSRHFLQRARSRLSHPDYAHRSALWQVDLAETWPWPEGKFDGIICHYVLPYLPKNAQVSILAEACRTLKPKGSLLVSFMVAGADFRAVIKYNLGNELRHNPFVALRALLLRPIFTNKVDRARDQGLLYSFSEQEFEQIAYQAGFSQVELIERGLPGPQGPIVPIYKLTK